MTYIKQMKNAECNQSIVRIFEDIKMDRIKDFIENIEGMSKTRKNFYQKLLEQRYEMLKNVYDKLMRKA